MNKHLFISQKLKINELRTSFINLLFENILMYLQSPTNIHELIKYKALVY